MYKEIKKRLFERNKKVEVLEKQGLKDKAELEAKDKLIEKECCKVENLQQQLEELQAKNRQLEELLE